MRKNIKSLKTLHAEMKTIINKRKLLKYHLARFENENFRVVQAKFYLAQTGFRIIMFT